MKSELKPCPFCGKQPQQRVLKYGKELKLKPVYYLQCGNQECELDVKAFGYSKAGVRKKWNKRAEPEPIDEWPMPWCEACQSYHIVPRDKAHQELLQCFAKLEEKT